MSPSRLRSLLGGQTLKIKTMRGAAWTMIGFGGSQAIRLASNLILARLLFPEAFGTMAIVNIVMTGLQMFSEIGIGPSIIQNPRGADSRFRNTAWTLQIIRGFALSLIAALLAWPVAAFYEEPQLFALIAVVGCSAAITGFQSTSMFIAPRELTLARLTFIRLIQYAAMVAVVVGWAAVYPSVWALAAGNVIGAAMWVVVSHVALPRHHHRLAWERESLDALLGLGRWIMFSTMIAFAVTWGDRLFMGKAADIATLGVYSIAGMLAALPANLFHKVAANVALPAISRVIERGGDPAPAIRRLRTPMTAGAAVIGVVLASSAPWAIPMLYDPRYADASWFLVILSVAGLFQALETTCSNVMLAHGRGGYLAVCNATKLGSMLVLVPIGLHFGGLVGALFGFVLSDVIRYAVAAGLCSRLGVRVSTSDTLVILALIAGIGVGIHAGYAVGASGALVGQIVSALVAAGAGLFVAGPITGAAVKIAWPRGLVTGDAL